MKMVHLQSLEVMACLCLCLVATVRARILPLAEEDVNGHDDNEVSYPSYSYNYSVQDQQTGDKKSAWEMRQGDVVKGSYTVVHPDGSIRTVDYTADKYRGFRAVIRTTFLHHMVLTGNDGGSHKGRA